MYQGYVVEIKELRKHSNADKLQIATVFGNNVIVGLNVKVRDIYCYFPTDGRLGENYCNQNNLIRKKDENGKDVGGYLEEGKRKLGTIRLRGEYSDGLLMPIESLSYLTDILKLKVGDYITTINGELICEKYVVQNKNKVSSGGLNKEKKQKKVEIVSYPFFQEHIDTSQYSYNKNVFKEKDIIYITLKMHGTSGRTGYLIKETKKLVPKWLYEPLHYLGLLPKPKKEWELVSGTRRVVLKNKTDGFYNDTFRNKHHDFFYGKLQKGETAYYEIVGYTDAGNLIMSSADNKKTKDKEFIKQFGDKTHFTYGCNQGESEMYIYRITLTNEDGYVVELPWEIVKLRAEQMGAKVVPELDKFLFTTIEDLDERVNRFVDGIDPIGKTHIREGVVIRVENKEKFTAYKHKSYNFKVLENIIKLDDEIDLEEQS